MILKERNQDNYVMMSDVLNLSFWVLVYKRYNLGE
jgi:hypothetical protein